MYKVEYSRLLNVIMTAAKRAGEQLLECQSATRSSVRRQVKEDGTIVTAADRLSNEVILDALDGAYPGVGVFSEESPRDPDYRAAVSHYVVDPLDGSNQFVHGLSDFTVSIAFTEQRTRFHRPMLGVVHRPVGNNTYFAVRGKGAWHCSGDEHPRRLSVSTVTDWSRARLVCSALRSDPRTKRLQELSPSYTGRGSAALMICLVAEGKFDWYAHVADRHLAEYDVCAAGLILTEAGGRLGHATGGSVRYNRVEPHMKNGVVAAGRASFKDAVGAIRELFIREP